MRYKGNMTPVLGCCNGHI